MFDRRFPHSRIKLPNTVFEYEVYRMKAPRFAFELQEFHTRALIWVHLIAWGVSITTLVLGGSALWIMLAVLLAIVGISCASDIYAVTVALNRADEWDVLRLTLLDREALIQAKIAAGQIRAWRLLSIDVALRFVGIELALFLAMTSTRLFRVFGRGFGFVLPPVEVLAVPFGLVIIALALFFEPYWRQRALVTATTRIVIADEENANLAAMMVILSMLMIRVIAFGAMLLACLYPFFRLRPGRFFAEDFTLWAVIMRWIAPLLMIGGLALGLYLSTRAIEYLALRQIRARFYDNESGSDFTQQQLQQL